MTNSKTKLEMLTEAMENLSYVEKLSFESVFIGSLSVLCNEKQWNQALATAQGYSWREKQSSAGQKSGS